MDYKKIMDSLFKENFELEKQRDQYKEERDTLIDKNEKLKSENKALRLQADEYFELWQNELQNKESE